MNKNKINKIMVVFLALVMLGFIIGAVVPVLFSGEKPHAKFQNGDIVVHTLSEREGQVVDNSYEFNRKSNCWKVKIRFKNDTKTDNALSNKISKMIDDVPLTFNEFELEKQ